MAKRRIKSEKKAHHFEKKVSPYSKVDHTKVILTDEQVRERTEIEKDWSKEMATASTGRGMHSTYLGKHASNRKKVIARIWKYLGRHRVGLTFVAISIAITSGLAVLIPWLFAIAIDDYFLTQNFEGAYKIGGYIIIVSLLNSIVRYFGRYLMILISQDTVYKIRQDAFDNLQKLPVRYYDQNQAGTIVSRLTNDMELINSSLSEVTLGLIASVITITGSLVMMFIVNWALSLVVIGFLPIMIIITMQISKRTRSGFIAQQKHLGSLNGIIEESISGMDIVKLYSLQDKFKKHFEDTNTKLKNASFKAQFLAGLVMPIITFLNNLIYVVIVFIGGLIKILGWAVITIGDISAITQYARQFVQPIAQLAQLFNTLQQGLAGAERVFELIDEKTEYENDSQTPVEHLKGHVEFNHVTFGYDEGKTVLRDITFEAKKGRTVAIVGPTGSGKTTIINLLNRFYDIEEGTIKVDDKNITEYDRDQYRQNVGVVLQDTSLFTGTVYDNIVYGKRTASKEDVEAAAKLANAHDFIDKLPQGYDSVVDEGGKNFSHGERQLISIARTILSDPDILILDEATSNVDTRTEFKIQESMNILMKNRTSFVIAHRLQTIRNADKIIVIKDGEIIETGDHHALLNEKGFYYDLYTTQFKELIKE